MHTSRIPGKGAVLHSWDWRVVWWGLEQQVGGSTGKQGSRLDAGAGEELRPGR